MYIYIYICRLDYLVVSFLVLVSLCFCHPQKKATYLALLSCCWTSYCARIMHVYRHVFSHFVHVSFCDSHFTYGCQRLFAYYIKNANCALHFRTKDVSQEWVICLKSLSYCNICTCGVCVRACEKAGENYTRELQHAHTI